MKEKQRCSWWRLYARRGPGLSKVRRACRLKGRGDSSHMVRLILGKNPSGMPDHGGSELWDRAAEGVVPSGINERRVPALGGTVRRYQNETRRVRLPLLPCLREQCEGGRRISVHAGPGNLSASTVQAAWSGTGETNRCRCALWTVVNRSTSGLPKRSRTGRSVSCTVVHAVCKVMPGRLSRSARRFALS